MPTLNESVKVRLVRGVLDSSEAYVDLTYPGFGLPKAAIIFCGASQPDINVTYGSYSKGSVGLYSYGNAVCAMGWAMDSSVATSNTARASKWGVGVVIPNTSGSGNLIEYNCGATTDGLRLTKVTMNSSSSKSVQVLLIAGDGVTGTSISQKQVNGGSIFTTTGITANAAFFLNSSQAAATSTATRSNFGFGYALKNYNGAATGTIKQGSINFIEEDGYSISSARTWHASGQVQREPDNGAGVTVTAFNNGSITFGETHTSTNYMFCLGIEFDDTQPGACRDRLGVFPLWDEANNATGPYQDEKNTLTMSPDNFGSFAMTIMANGTQNVQHTSGNTLLSMGIAVVDPEGTHGGMSWVSDDSQTTMSNGGHMNDIHAHKMPTVTGQGSGYAVKYQMMAAEMGLKVRMLGGHAALPSQYYLHGSTFLMGIGTRSAFVGDKWVNPSFHYPVTHIKQPVYKIYKGSNLIWGDDSV